MALYNLDSTASPADLVWKQERIEAYLGIPNLSTAQQTVLETPISQTELLATVKSLFEGKSPGPDGYTKAYYLKFFTRLKRHLCAPSLNR